MSSPRIGSVTKGILSSNVESFSHKDLLEMEVVFATNAFEEKGTVAGVKTFDIVVEFASTSASSIMRLWDKISPFSEDSGKDGYNGYNSY